MRRADRWYLAERIEDALRDAERMVEAHGMSASRACAAAARLHGLYMPHLRDEWLRLLLDAREEAQA